MRLFMRLSSRWPHAEQVRALILLEIDITIFVDSSATVIAGMHVDAT